LFLRIRVHNRQTLNDAVQLDDVDDAPTPRAAAYGGGSRRAPSSSNDIASSRPPTPEGCATAAVTASLDASRACNAASSSRPVIAR
jgi:hypothetical protein